MKTTPLKRLGLSESEIKVYVELLKLGKASASQLAESSGIHRTNIYSILDKLKSMGLASDFKEEGKLTFRASDPQNLLNYLKESEVSIQSLLPDLNKIKESVKEKVEVEVLRGPKGTKSAYNGILRERKELLGFVITGQLRKHLPVYAKQWIREMVRLKIKNRYIYVEGTSLAHPEFEVRCLPKEFTTPNSTLIYGDKIMLSLWEPSLISIVITSKQVANDYRRYFELLWSIAKKC